MKKPVPVGLEKFRNELQLNPTIKPALLRKTRNFVAILISPLRNVA